MNYLFEIEEKKDRKELNNTTNNDQHALRDQHEMNE
jgi:hypothetical protein